MACFAAGMRLLVSRTTLTGASDRGPQVRRPERVEHGDDPVAAQSGCVRERWSPVAVANAGILVKECRGGLDECAHRAHVIAPDRINQLARLHQSRPAWRPVAARQYELGVGALGTCGIDRAGVALGELGDCGGFAAVNIAEQILGLVPELVQVGTDGQVTSGHDEPP